MSIDIILSPFRLFVEGLDLSKEDIGVRGRELTPKTRLKGAAH
jgi:hypothetical protein